MRVLVTGARGFVGGRLLTRLAADGRLAMRGAGRAAGPAPAPIEWMASGAVDAETDWRPLLADVQLVVHLAARVHVMRDRSSDPLQAFRLVNVDGTLNLARQAAAAGVSRLVFLSSVKVNGEAGRFTEASAPAPADPYGISKLEAEVGLSRIADRTGLEVVVVRPPLVYGPGVKANFHALMQAVARGIPLPLASVDNRRSLVALDNLVDLIATVLDHPAAANQTFLVSDGEDCSTSDLIRRLGRAIGRPARLFPVPVSVLRRGAALVGRRDMVERLVGTLQVDIAKARQVLGWTPPISLDEGLRRAVVNS